MAFPVPETTNSGGGATSSSSFAVPLPASIQAGDLLIIGVANTDETNIPATPTGWDLGPRSDMSDDLYSIWTRTADGAEGASVTVTWPGGDEQVRAWSYRISGWGSFSFGSPSQGGSGTQPNTALYTPPGGADDILWINCVFCSASGHEIGNPPTNYTQGPGSDGTGVTTRTAYRAINAVSQDPGESACSGSTHGWDSLLIAVYPPSGAITVDVGQASEAETANSITPLISREVAVGQTTEAEAAGTITPLLSRVVQVGTATEAETANAISPLIARDVPVGQASEVELAQPISPLISRVVEIGTATERELGGTISPVKPIFVDLGTVIERELAQLITPVISSIGMVETVECEVVTATAVCSVSRGTAECETLSGTAVGRVLL